MHQYKLLSLSFVSNICYKCALNYADLMTAVWVQGSVLIQLSVNISTPSQQYMLNGINGEKTGCHLFYIYMYIYIVCIVDEVIVTITQR